MYTIKKKTEKGKEVKTLTVKKKFAVHRTIKKMLGNRDRKQRKK